ncbi:type VI secretion system baseplate subunit TssG [Burkholderia sp. Ac-20344]|uniref:type VI secretion system baseplate subunit TssG n=1 Tax=Burkholderia sp. Ac-20344 TaxID=2703890 RepID=UPI00197B0BBB|nr:type VI secretion system baseplate subunit TssG [Burkholderia sp. Ac-20344]MBN3837043.1 type VI secretion system baseplate subunit TssG [Burkholderia sp. Ac-20344]
MNFYRFCELLELAAPNRSPLGTTDSPVGEAVRFRSRARIGFPNREIDAVEYDPDRPAAPPDVRTTFLGLYGVDARMPSYFVDEIAQNREGADALSGFLDLFHHRIATQYYRVWRKYRYPTGFRPEGDDTVSRYLLNFAGLGLGDPEIARAVGIRKLLSMLGLAAQKTRTAEGLAGVLRHAVPDAHVTIEECHPVWNRVETREPGALGEGCLLGREFCDRANTVRVVIRPDTRESVLALMPGHSQHRALMALLRFYLGYEANAHLEMQVAPELMPGPRLSSTEVSLGYTSQLSLPGTNASTTAAVRVQLGQWTGGGADRVSGW